MTMAPRPSPPLLTQVFRVLLAIISVAGGIATGIAFHASQYGGDILLPCCIGVVLWAVVLSGARSFPGYPWLLGAVWIVVTLIVVGLLALF